MNKLQAQFQHRPTVKHWTDKDWELLSKAKSYKELRQVAINTLIRLPNPRIQICGPISSGGKGSRELNLIEMDKAILFFANKCESIFDIIVFQDQFQMIKSFKNISGHDPSLMDEFYKPIFRIGMINIFRFLPDWLSSDGAKVEHTEAKNLHIKVECLPDDWYQE